MGFGSTRELVFIYLCSQILTSYIHTGTVVVDHALFFVICQLTMDQHDQQEEDLIHLPLLSLESLLIKQNHPLIQNFHVDLWDVDANEIFHQWAVRRGYYAPSKNKNSTDNGSNRRRLQDIIGDGTHFIKLYVGNPAQVRVLALSSAADLTAWPCQVSFSIFTYLVH